MKTTETVQPDRLMSPKEAAEMLGLRENTLAVWRCTNRYPLPYVRVGTSVRYRLSAIEEFINARTVTPGSEN